MSHYICSFQFHFELRVQFDFYKYLIFISIYGQTILNAINCTSIVFLKINCNLCF